jgi:hypothetical protein
MSLRTWEARLGVRLDALEQASPVELADIHRRLLAHESDLDASAQELCERLVPLSNVKNARDLSELIARRWPDSPIGRELAEKAMEKEELRRSRDPSDLLKAANASRRPAATCWIKVAGTGDSPFDHGDWALRHRSWTREFGPVSMFPRRPRIALGDRLVVYAAGSHSRFGEGRVFSVEEVDSPAPEPSPDPRWPWMVRTRVVLAGPRLEHCPRITEIGVERRSLRRHSHIHISDSQERRAEKLIAEAAAQYGALVTT